MIPIPADTLEAIAAPVVRSANLYQINLGDAYANGSNVVYYWTDAAFDIVVGGRRYLAKNPLIEADGVTRKAGSGSDEIELVFSVADRELLKAIQARAYMNQPITISRVVLDEFGQIIGDAFPVRAARFISHEIESDDAEDSRVMMKADSALGALDSSNPYVISDALHQLKYPGDRIFRWLEDTRKENGDDDLEYSTDNPLGKVDSYTLPFIYGKKTVELKEVARLKHKKTSGHAFTKKVYYYTTIVLTVAHGNVKRVCMENLLMDDTGMSFRWSEQNQCYYGYGGWTAWVRTTVDDTKYSLKDDPKLTPIRENIDNGELQRFKGMHGHGLTTIILLNKVRDEFWVSGSKKFSVPVEGRSVFDPRVNKLVYSLNPALQLRDYLTDKLMGGGNLGVAVDDRTFVDAANYFDDISIGGVRTNAIKKIQTSWVIDSAEKFGDIVDRFAEAGRLYISDYTGKLSVKVEKPEAPAFNLTESDLIGGLTVTGQELSDRINRQIVEIETQVLDPNDYGTWVEVKFKCIYPQDTAAGRVIYDQWLKEDGGRQLEDEENADEIGSIRQGIYTAAVMARKARILDEAEATVGPIGWLLEPGDVVTIADKTADQTGRAWRITEVSEDNEGAVKLDLEGYDPAVYSPDLEDVPEPDFPATPPTSVIVGAPVLNAPVVRGNLFDLTWNDPETNGIAVGSYNVALFKVVADNDELILHNTVTANGYTFGPLESSISYIYQVTAINAQGVQGGTASDVIIIGEPPAPTEITVEASANTATVRPIVSPAPANPDDIKFKYWLKRVDNSAPMFAGIGYTMTFDGLTPKTDYLVTAKTVTPWGESTTTTDKEFTTAPAADVWTGVITSNNGLGWVRAPSGTWLPNQNDIVLTAVFSRPSIETILTATARAKLDQENAQFILTPETVPPDISVTITPPEVGMCSTVTFKHRDGLELSQIITLVVSGDQGQDGNPGERGSKHIDINRGSVNTWDDTIARNAFIDEFGNLLPWDSATQYSESAGFSESRFYNGSQWLKVAQIIDGGLIVHGTITGDKLESRTITGDKIAANSITANEINAASLKVAAANITGKLTVNQVDAQSILAQEMNAANIKGGNININNNFIVDANGNMTANSGVFKGNIYADKIIGDVVSTTVRKSNRIYREWPVNQNKFEHVRLFNIDVSASIGSSGQYLPTVITVNIGGILTWVARGAGYDRHNSFYRKLELSIGTLIPGDDNVYSELVTQKFFSVAENGHSGSSFIITPSFPELSITTIGKPEKIQVSLYYEYEYYQGLRGLTFIEIPSSYILISKSIARNDFLLDFKKYS